MTPFIMNECVSVCSLLGVNFICSFLIDAHQTRSQPKLSLYTLDKRSRTHGPEGLKGLIGIRLQPKEPFQGLRCT
jgi:hypothetical protein